MVRYSLIAAVGMLAVGAIPGRWSGLLAAHGRQPVRRPSLTPVAAAPERENAHIVEHFETRVRPLLTGRCAGCHSGAKAAAGLQLTSLATMLKGGNSGPAVRPGQPEKSLLIRALRGEGATRMPPSAPLREPEITALEEWIRLGALWPEQAAGPGRPDRHWAFQPVRAVAVPAVEGRLWVRTPVDAFVLAGLESRGLTPNRMADRRTLLRRAYLDLHGIPPTPAEAAAFLGDPSPDAWERLLDRLLASPRYGERWGRYWLDVARYADTKDYVFGGERRYPFSYVYRDYVVQAFNEDLPYDQFLREQLAADLLPNPRAGSLAAMGYLTLGPRFVNVSQEIVDDRIDVVFRGMQGLTVSCARCHDHKHDPISTAEYYSLYGVFAAGREATEPLEAPPVTPGYAAYAAGLARRERALIAALKQASGRLEARLREKVGDYLSQVPAARAIPGEEVYRVLEAGDLNPIFVRRWREYLDRPGRESDPVFAPWKAYESAGGDFSRQAVRITAALDPDRLDARVYGAFTGRPPRSMADVASRYGRILSQVAKENGVDRSTPVGRVLFASDSPVRVPPLGPDQLDYYFDEETRKRLYDLQGEVDRWQIESPHTPPHAMVLRDAPSVGPQRIFLRGNPATPGRLVERGFPAALAGGFPLRFHGGSGRLELARAIASPSNPLTARVLVNRVWLGHFGEGLVRTPSDFGRRGEPPSHPELLDYLAGRFVAEGWSVKALHRLLMCSSVYMQANGTNPAAERVDPENRLLWRMNPRRLDLESLRDSLLSCSARLDPTLGGPPVDLDTTGSTRRTLYGLVDRQNLPELYRVFDFPAPMRHSPRRQESSAPQQALFLMNSPFMRDCARSLAARDEIGVSLPDPQRVRALYRVLFSREPTAAEVTTGKRFLAGDSSPWPLFGKAPAIRPELWDEYVQALMLTNEFAFVD